MHPGQQHDEPLGRVVQAGEQPRVQAVVEGQDRRRLDLGPVSGAAGLVNRTRRLLRVLNSDRIADSVSSRVVPDSGARAVVRSSVVTWRSDWYRADQLASGTSRTRRYPWIVLVCRARPARGPWPCSASAQVCTSSATGAGRAASRAASQVPRTARGLARARPWSVRNSTARSATRRRSFRNRSSAAMSQGGWPRSARLVSTAVTARRARRAVPGAQPRAWP